MIPQTMLQRRKNCLFGRSLQFMSGALAMKLNNGLNSKGKLLFIAQDGMRIRKFFTTSVDSQQYLRSTRILLQI
jgi:hypothetical protein